MYTHIQEIKSSIKNNCALRDISHVKELHADFSFSPQLFQFCVYHIYVI